MKKEIMIISQKRYPLDIITVRSLGLGSSNGEVA